MANSGVCTATESESDAPGDRDHQPGAGPRRSASNSGSRLSMPFQQPAQRAGASPVPIIRVGTVGEPPESIASSSWSTIQASADGIGRQCGLFVAHQQIERPVGEQLRLPLVCREFHARNRGGPRSVGGRRPPGRSAPAGRSHSTPGLRPRRRAAASARLSMIASMRRRGSGSARNRFNPPVGELRQPMLTSRVGVGRPVLEVVVERARGNPEPAAHLGQFQPAVAESDEYLESRLEVRLPETTVAMLRTLIATGVMHVRSCWQTSRHIPDWSSDIPAVGSAQVFVPIDTVHRPGAVSLGAVAHFRCAAYRQSGPGSPPSS